MRDSRWFQTPCSNIVVCSFAVKKLLLFLRGKLNLENFWTQNERLLSVHILKYGTPNDHFYLWAWKDGVCWNCKLNRVQAFLGLRYFKVWCVWCFLLVRFLCDMLICLCCRVKKLHTTSSMVLFTSTTTLMVGSTLSMGVLRIALPLTSSSLKLFVRMALHSQACQAFGGRSKYIYWCTSLWV